MVKNNQFPYTGSRRPLRRKDILISDEAKLEGGVGKGKQKCLQKKVPMPEKSDGRKEGQEGKSAVSQSHQDLLLSRSFTKMLSTYPELLNNEQFMLQVSRYFFYNKSTETLPREIVREIKITCTGIVSETLEDIVLMLEGTKDIIQTSNIRSVNEMDNYFLVKRMRSKNFLQEKAYQGSEKKPSERGLPHKTHSFDN